MGSSETCAGGGTSGGAVAAAAAKVAEQNYGGRTYEERRMFASVAGAGRRRRGETADMTYRTPRHVAEQGCHKAHGGKRHMDRKASAPGRWSKELKEE